jgi:tRNA nucleotidyltransferase (CCA-adding enzyme)
MKVYLVGGAVRDQLLKLPVKERDWVVVGSSPDELIAKGFRQVGRDFPVFLHPETHDEYALARTERKSSPGYYGFSCDFNKNVSLEEDLARRDLTINAIALDEQGLLIDPFQGINDLENKILRHVSPAFIEDPVRVLRVARFAARFHHLGFKLADETRSLMYRMVQSGELSHLVPERVWQELQTSLEEKNPEQFFIILRSCDALRVIFPEIHTLFGIPNPYRYHHEIDSGIHTMLVLQAASALTVDPIVRFAALVHDLGKATSPVQNWPSHHGHEERGVSIIEAFCTRLRIPNEFRNLAVMVSRFHLQIHRLFELRANTIVKIFDQSDAFRRPHLFYTMLIACQADAEGCGQVIDYRQSKLWSYLLAECAKVNAQQIIAEGYTGETIKQILHQRRVACVELILNSWKSHEK